MKSTGVPWQGSAVRSFAKNTENCPGSGFGRLPDGVRELQFLSCLKKEIDFSLEGIYR
jgi:hypothetical protein